MSPFGGYEDFDACVRANKDKGNPAAYCASIHKKATGRWPAEKELTLAEELEVEKDIVKAALLTELGRTGLLKAVVIHELKKAMPQRYRGTHIHPKRSVKAPRIPKPQSKAKLGLLSRMKRKLSGESHLDKL